MTCMGFDVIRWNKQAESTEKETEKHYGSEAIKQEITQAAIDTAKATVVAMMEVGKEGRRPFKGAGEANVGESVRSRAHSFQLDS